jgi:predicted nucleotidyltransferase
MLLNLFSSGTRVDILSMFLLNPDTDKYLREIARETGDNVNSVRRELNNLEGIGLLKSLWRGKQKYYSVNKSFPLYNELKSVFMKTAGAGSMISEKLKELEGINRTFIFGSYALGNFEPDSDIDLMVIGNVNEDLLIETISVLEEETGREINYILMTEKEYESRDKSGDPFISEVKSGKIIELEV